MYDKLELDLSADQFQMGSASGTIKKIDKKMIFENENFLRMDVLLKMSIKL